MDASVEGRRHSSHGTGVGLQEAQQPLHDVGNVSGLSQSVHLAGHATASARCVRPPSSRMAVWRRRLRSLRPRRLYPDRSLAALCNIDGAVQPDDATLLFYYNIS